MGPQLACGHVLNHALTKRTDGGIGTHGELLLSEATETSIFLRTGLPAPLWSPLRRLAHCDNWQVHASAEASIGTPSEPKALVKTFATSKRNNNNHGACACRALQILHHRIHEADAVTAASEHRVNNHVGDVEVKNTIANDPGETQQAAIFAEANCVECAGDGLACGLAVHIRRSHELSELDKFRWRDRFLNDHNVGHDDLLDGPFCLAWPGRGTGEVALAPRRSSRP